MSDAPRGDHQRTNEHYGPAAGVAAPAPRVAIPCASAALAVTAMVRLSATRPPTPPDQGRHYTARPVISCVTREVAA